MTKISPFFFAVAVALVSVACGQSVQHAPKAPIAGETVIDLPVEDADTAEDTRFSRLPTVDYGRLAQHFGSSTEIDCSVQVTRAETSKILGTFPTIEDARFFAEQNLKTVMCDETSCTTTVDADLYYNEGCEFADEDFEFASN